MNDFELHLKLYVAAVKSVEFWKSHGTWGDGKLDKAKADRAAAKKALTRYVNKCLANQEGGK